MKRWNEFWFGPEAPLNLIVARAIIAIDTLWLLLSRPTLPTLFQWPHGFWSHVDQRLLVRFTLFPPSAAVEWILFGVLLSALVAALLGFATRGACLAAGLLLYHFAPLEDVFSSEGGPFFRGFSVPVLALLILGFAMQPRRTDSSSSEFRWPLALIRLLFSFTYLFSGISKLFVPGIREWVSATHFQLIVAGLATPDATMPWAHYFLEHRTLAVIAAAGVLALDLLFITVLFSRRAAFVVIPAALAMHLLSPRIIGVVFLSTPLLLLFVDWNAVRLQFRSCLRQAT